MGKKLYVGNLSPEITADDLEQLFFAFGKVRSAQVIRDSDSGHSKGFGFVEMGSDQAAKVAIAGLSGKKFGGRNLIVNEVTPREDGGRRRGRGVKRAGHSGGGRRH